MPKMTARQDQVLDIIKEKYDKTGLFPSLREIADALGVRNKSGVIGHLKALERKGHLCRQPQNFAQYKLHDKTTLSSSIESSQAKQEQSFSLVGTIPAGAPLQIYEQDNESLNFDPSYFGGGDLKAVTVSGESMAGDHISDGDIAIIKMTQEVTESDILVLRVDRDEVTLKRIKASKDVVELLPSNPAYAIKIVPSEQLEILGKLVGLVRKTR